MVDQQELESLLGTGHEIRSFEAKCPGSLSDKAYVAQVAKASMALGNHPDGGVVCLGIDDAQMSNMAPGLDAATLGEWSDYDNVSAALARYSDPPVAFDFQTLTLSSGASVVVLGVREFEHLPHICKRGYPGVLQAGATYVRSLRQPESVPVPSSTEMREVLDLATNKALRDFIARATAAGLTLGGTPTKTQQQLDQAAFESEAQEGWG